MRASTVGILRQRRQIFIVHDRGRHVPGRIDRDVFHGLAQQRRLHAGLADHDPGGPDLGAVVHHLEREVRLVDEHMGVAEIARIPAPALHVGDDGVDLLVVAGSRSGARLAAQLRERRLELAIGLMLRAEFLEHLACVRGLGELLRSRAGSGGACGSSMLRLTRV